MVPLSILDLAPIGEGQSTAQSFENSVRLAQAAESVGYQRFWLAEHHGMNAVASAATSVLIAHIGHHTKTIRIGSGGIMLPNHSPLVIAEQFGTLATLFPGRIDLGLGRAPGTDHATSRALKRGGHEDVNQYPQDVLQLQHFLGEEAGQVIAVPGKGTNVPLWLLGSSLYSAQLAAQLGLPFAFASHFAPDFLRDAIRVYRKQFQPSAQLEKPYVMVGAMSVVADTDAEAQYLSTTVQQQFVNLRRGINKPSPGPVDSMQGLWTTTEKAGVEHTLHYSLIGSSSTVATKMTALLEQVEVDEIILSFPIYDIDARIRAVELAAAIQKR